MLPQHPDDLTLLRLGKLLAHLCQFLIADSFERDADRGVNDKAATIQHSAKTNNGCRVLNGYCPIVSVPRGFRFRRKRSAQAAKHLNVIETHRAAVLVGV